MQRVTDSIEYFRDWIGQEFTCPATQQKYRVDDNDVQGALTEAKGIVSDTALICPDCGKKVTFEHGQMSGSYLSHSV